ncbi:hypothetical protein [Arthrobacter sp. H-02-3]|nr:hypothetical protein [Arthrobacter sp. H-02-3]
MNDRNAMEACAAPGKITQQPHQAGKLTAAYRVARKDQMKGEIDARD